MRWLNTQRRRLPLCCQDGFSCRTFVGSIGELFLSVFLKLLQIVKRPMEQNIVLHSNHYYLTRLVNNFTYSGNTLSVRSFCKLYSYVPSSQHAPSRTIRRVHVMPWATPIRRIGSMRVNCIGQESDDPAGSGRRRF